MKRRIPAPRASPAQDAQPARLLPRPVQVSRLRGGYQTQCQVMTNSSSRERSGGIRAWAKDIAVSDRDRLPASVVEQYEAATK